MTDSEDRYFARPTDVPGCFLLWDGRSDTAVYGAQLSSEKEVEADARRLNNIYRQFRTDGGGGLPERSAASM
jgi:hypothetical protein